MLSHPSAPEGAGYWFPPTVLSPVSNDDRAARDEIFGPIAAVIPFEDEAEARLAVTPRPHARTMPAGPLPGINGRSGKN